MSFLIYFRDMVRHIREDELPHLLELYRLFHPEEKAADPLSSDTLRTWQTIFSNPDLRYYVFERNNQIVSTCALSIIPNLNHNLKPYGLIENVVTNPNHRKMGFATQVIQYALKEAWSFGCYKVMLLTGSKNEETLKFYEKAGFQRGVKTGFIAYPKV